MSSNNTKGTFVTALLAASLGGAISGNALAQDERILMAQTGTTPAGIASSGQEAEQGRVLEEILVTARRREENLMEVPMSIQAISADEMQAQGIYNVQFISDFAPNVSLSEIQRKNDTRVYIRGIGGGFNNPNRVWGTGMYVDGHYLTSSLGSFMSTADIERVEVLRGPQGTLFGKNTTGGAINVITAKPGPEFDAYVKLRAGNFGEQSVRAMVNFPISDNVFARVNVADEQTDGFYYNAFRNEYVDGTDEQSLGLALRFTPGDDWIIDARLAIARDRDGNRGGQCETYPSERLIRALNNDPAGTPVNLAYVGPGPGPRGSFAEGAGAWGGRRFNGIGRVEGWGPGTTVAYLEQCDTMRAMGDYVNFSNTDVFSYVDNHSFNLDATWESPGAIGPFEQGSVQIRAATKETSYRYQQENEYAEWRFTSLGNVPNRTGKGTFRETNEFEVIFNGAVSDRLDFTAGAYWLDDVANSGTRDCLNRWQAAWNPLGDNGDPGNDGEFGTVDDPLGTINGMLDDDITCPAGGGHSVNLSGVGEGPPGYSTGETTGQSIALYGHLDFAINANWELGLGARWMEEDRTQTSFDISAVANACTMKTAGEIAPADLCVFDLLLNRESILDDGSYTDAQATYGDVTPMISLTRTLAPGGTLNSGIFYFLISEGFLTGAFNDELSVNIAEPFRSAVQILVPFGPEHVTNYEAGFKGTMLDGRLQLAADVFLMDYTDKQENIEIDNSEGKFGGADTIDYTSNVADVEITGLEIELKATPWDGGFVSLDVGWLHNEYSKYLIFDLEENDFVDLSDRRIQSRTPDWTVTASIDHVFQLGNGGTLTPQLGMYMQDEYEWAPALAGFTAPPLRVNEESQKCHQDFYSKWRMRLTYEAPGAAWQVSLYGNNITDERIFEDCEYSGRSGSIRFAYGPPDWWGAEFSMGFGAGR